MLDTGQFSFSSSSPWLADGQLAAVTPLGPFPMCISWSLFLSLYEWVRTFSFICP